jgi:hypothetical protein
MHNNTTNKSIKDKKCMRIFKAGDLVVCIDSGSEKLTAGKTYIVLTTAMLPCGIDEWDFFLDVEDDYGNNGYSFAHRFQLKSEWLERRLSEIGIDI